MFKHFRHDNSDLDNRRKRHMYPKSRINIKVNEMTKKILEAAVISINDNADKSMLRNKKAVMPKPINKGKIIRPGLTLSSILPELSTIDPC